MDTDGVDPSLFQPIFLRQRNFLNLAFWHAQILVHRPFLLNNFSSLANLASSGQKENMQNAEVVIDHVQQGLRAAMSIVGKLEELDTAGQLYSTLWVCFINACFYH